MTDALKEAAEAASEALGATVNARAATGAAVTGGSTRGFYDVDVWTRTGGGLKWDARLTRSTHAAALAYLEGLTQGAHIANTKRAAVLDWGKLILAEYEGSHSYDDLAAALADLEA